MAKAAIAQRNGRGVGSRRRMNNNPVDEIVHDAERIYELLLKDSPSDDYTQTGQGQNVSRAAVEGQRAKQTSRERRRKSSSPLGTRETNKKSKNAFEDDGSQSREDDDSRDKTKSERDEISMRKTSRPDAPKLSFCVGVKAPLAEPEDSTVTPEAEPDVDQKLSLLRCKSRSTDTDNYYEADDDEADHGSNPDDDEYDDIDGDPDASDLKAAEEKDKILTEIALKLRKIGDVENSNIAADQMTRSASTVSLSMVAINGIQDLVSNLTYEKFQDVVNKNMGSEPGVQQVTVMFRLAKAVVGQVGNGTKAAGRLRTIAMDYFSNNVASWVVENGGWEGIAERL